MLDKILYVVGKSHGTVNYSNISPHTICMPEVYSAGHGVQCQPLKDSNSMRGMACSISC